VTEATLTGEQLKRAGQQLSLNFAGDWSERVVAEFRGWAAIEKARGMRTCTIERFRAEAQNHPPTHKAWGSLPRLLVKAGLIESTGEYRKAAAPRTRSHPVALWRLP